MVAYIFFSPTLFPALSQSFKNCLFFFLQIGGNKKNVKIEVLYFIRYIYIILNQFFLMFFLVEEISSCYLE